MAKVDKTRARVYQTPTLSTIKWSDIEAPLVSLGATLKEGNGSRVRVELNGVRRTYHRPHPQKEATKGAVESARQQITEAGAGP